MKALKSILAAIALIMLMAPCVHAESHDHAEEAHSLSAPECGLCHTCSDETVCSKPAEAVQTDLSSPAMLPVRVDQLIVIVEPFVPVPVAAPRPPGGLHLLQSVQLLT